MSIELAEELKKELTDKYVVVAESIPELKRFSSLTGRVKTVNMNGRALVEFDGPEDIGWYDIAPEFLTIVDAPQPKKKAAPKAKTGDAKSAPAKPAADAGKTLSPLELARQQGAGGGAPAAAEPAKPAAETSGKKLSPLELARQQGAAGSAPAAAPQADAPAPAADSGKKLSPLEMARMQDAGGGAAPAAPAAESKPAPAAVPSSDKKLSPLEMARMQDAGGAAAPPAEAPAPKPAAEEPPAEAPGESSGGGGDGFVPTPGDTAAIIALAREQGGFSG